MKNICVFGSSSEKIDRAYLDTAEKLGELIVEKGFGVIYGAGQYGIMGAVHRGVRRKNGSLIGVTPDFFLDMGVLVKDYGELIVTDTMRERKGIMEEKADAFIICAGGIGTFEEFFEILTLKQLGQHKKPIVILNTLGYYDAMLEMMGKSIGEKFMTENVKRLYTIAQTPEQALEQIENYQPFSYNKYD